MHFLLFASFCFTTRRELRALLSAGITEIFLVGGEGARKDEVQRALPARPGAAGDFGRGHVRFVGPAAFPASVAAGGGEGVPYFHLCGHRSPSVGRAAARVRGARRALAHAAPELCGRVSPPQLFLDRVLPGRAGYRQVFNPLAASKGNVIFRAVSLKRKQQCPPFRCFPPPRSKSHLCGGP